MNYYKGFDFDAAKRLIRQALKEDVGRGDITTELTIPQDSRSIADILIKQDGIIAGLRIFAMVFHELDKDVKVNFSVNDGQKVVKGQIAGIVKGRTRSMLTGERVALNILQRMSGIATNTHRLKTILANERAKIIDTRKTTPNFRLFEKLAVRIGGGENHRFGLYDMILVKDNHIDASGGIPNVIEILRKKKKDKNIRVEVEVRNLNQLKQLINFGSGVVDRVMLDNFKLSKIAEAVRMIGGIFEVEISGGINEKNISRYSGLSGIDYISIGSLTHSSKSLDISFNFVT